MNSLRDWIKEQLHPAPKQARADPDALRLAMAALLVEVLRADYQVTPEERGQVIGSLRAMLGLDATASERLLERAEHSIDHSHDLYQFTSLINQSCSGSEKEYLVEQLWRVARADATIHKYEEHLVRRIADLLHVPHSAFIAAKLRSNEGST